MALRPNWKGFLKVSLVSFPINMYKGTSSSSRISFHQLHKDTKQRIKLVPHDPKLGPVSRDDLVKGYEFEKGRYVIVEPSELDQIKLETTRTIEVERFVSESDIDELYINSPYYLAPDGPVAEEPFRVFIEAMKRKKVAGIARVVMNGRERVIAIKARGNGIVLTTLRYAQELRTPEPYFEDVGTGPVDKQMLTLAEQLIEQLFGEFDAKEFSDHYSEAVLELVKAKIAGRPTEIVEEVVPGADVISFMETLRQSVEEGGEVKKKPAVGSVRRRAPNKKKVG